MKRALTEQPWHNSDVEVSGNIPEDTIYKPVQEMRKSEYHFYHKLIKDDIDEIVPIFDGAQISYPMLDGIADGYDLEDMIRILDSLVLKGWLLSDGSKMVMGCPLCESQDFHIKAHCTKCGSGGIKSNVIIEHKLCGYKGFRNQFEVIVGVPCTKCGQLVEKDDVSVLWSLFVCDSCGTRFDSPELEYTCKTCGGSFNERTVRYKIFKGYKLLRAKPKPMHEKVQPVLSQRIDEDMTLSESDNDEQASSRIEPDQFEPVAEPDSSEIEAVDGATKPDDPSSFDQSRRDEEQKPSDKTSEEKGIEQDTNRRVLVLTEDRILLRRIGEAFDRFNEDLDIKLVYYVNTRQLLRSLRTKSDLIIVDYDSEVDVERMFIELNRWKVNTPVIFISRNLDGVGKSNLEGKGCVVLPMDRVGLKRMVDLLS